MESQSHSIISPAIHYWGTPVVLVSSENEDGTSNIAAMSSAWWLGDSCVLGLAAESKTAQNIQRTQQCVLNLADDSMAAYVNELADTTGVNPVPLAKQGRNYKFVKDKWTKSGLTPQPSDLVRPFRIAECPAQMECNLVKINDLWSDSPGRAGLVKAIEVRVLRVHVMDRIRMDSHQNRIDPDKWNPLIMSFQHFYGLKSSKVSTSVLARVDEEKYRPFQGGDVKKVPVDSAEPPTGKVFEEETA
ncbi:hypothetical protein GQ53DRAFT_851841 [Thozetella sp. PMI_491]|nr:hypothetical protein GQ53DRAFT_851841 [Thozetella sp. PMI_491]